MTVMQMYDCIIVINGGQVKEEVTYEELVELRSHFAMPKESGCYILFSLHVDETDVHLLYFRRSLTHYHFMKALFIWDHDAYVVQLLGKVNHHIIHEPTAAELARWSEL